MSSPRLEPSCLENFSLFYLLQIRMNKIPFLLKICLKASKKLKFTSICSDDHGVFVTPTDHCAVFLNFCVLLNVSFKTYLYHHSYTGSPFFVQSYSHTSIEINIDIQFLLCALIANTERIIFILVLLVLKMNVPQCTKNGAKREFCEFMKGFCVSYLLRLSGTPFIYFLNDSFDMQKLAKA